MSFYTIPITKKLNKNDWLTENPDGYRLLARVGQSKLCITWDKKEWGIALHDFKAIA